MNFRLQCLFETGGNASKKLELEGIKPQVTFLGDGHAPCQKAVLDFLGELFVCSSSFPPALILNEFAGGMFYYRDGDATYGLKNNSMILYKQDDDNPLLNDFGCYILDRLHKVQNMQDYAMLPVCDTADIDIDKYVSHTKKFEDGTTIYRFSRELLAYLKTLVAFSPYYYADDSRSAENIDKYYKSALKLYMDIEYEQVHAYLAGCLKIWYNNHPRNRLERVYTPPEEAAVGDAID